jgi:sulfur-oxidizing protein SoxA
MPYGLWRIGGIGAALLASMVAAAEILPGDRRSGFDFMSPETQRMQSDDSSNPGMLWVLEGERLWSTPAGASARACSECHGDAVQSMRGVATRYPAFDKQSGRPIDMAGRINQCRVGQQQAEPLPRESDDLLAITTYVVLQSRGMPVAPAKDKRLDPFRENGKQLFQRRMGQLDLACASCHDGNWGKRLGGSPIPQAHPTGYPIYRLEWQAVGSLQRRLRNCMVGIRAEPFGFGSPEFIDLELYLMSRAEGLPIETPGVRP